MSDPSPELYENWALVHADCRKANPIFFKGISGQLNESITLTLLLSFSFPSLKKAMRNNYKKYLEILSISC